jgi:drug/metabolite transporter (DMT)-like permease
VIQPGVLWGLATAAAWGTADFTGGLAARRVAPLAVTAGSQLIGLVALVGGVLLLGPPIPAPGTLLLGAVAGLGGGLGLAFLYEGLARGSMGIVSALSGAGAAVIPLLATLLLGTQIAPVALVGVALIVGAGLAAADISRDAASRSSLLLAFGAAIGFSSWYLIIDRAAADGGIWALVASRTASVLLIGGLVLATKARASVPSLRSVLLLVAVAGILDVGANVFFVIARGEISVALAATLSGLYPLATMLLARIVLGERLPRLGLVSVLLAVTGTILISISRS